MDRKAIQRILDYIEDNLKAEISVEELSDLAGFSLFHFYRLFQSAVGMPVMQYITRRRLLHGIHEISLGHKKIDVALSYGYETYAGFYKSFVREIGYTPKVYLKMYKAKKPYQINILQEEHIIMSQKKIRDILINWELENEKIADVVYGETGEISDSAKYVGEDYVIKFSANLGSIKKTIDISHALESIGLLAAQTIPTKDGKYYVEDAGLYYVLSKRIQGENIKVGSVYLDEYLEKARFIGEIVGQLSLALAKIDVVVDDMNILKNVCEWAIPALNEKVVIDKSFLESYQRRFRELYDELPKASGYSKEFFEAHRDVLLLRSAAKEAFKKMDGKLPTVKALDEEFQKLLQEKKELYVEYKPAKERMQELLMAKQNVERFLNLQEMQEQDYQKKKNNPSL